ncbi:MAG TPA: sigma-70 family RNA polymerase sigma factor [Chloroflexota bacterium]|nr:sigma-70 family RNA polymerase sigma factor [Chloroflexota bacterium]
MGQPEVSDEDLIAGIRDNDVRALEVFYDRYRVPAYSLCLRLLGNAGDAEDVVQEAFVNVWRAAGSYRMERSTPRSWLLSVVHHRAIDKLRARQSRPIGVELDDTLPLPDTTDVWREVESKLTGETVRTALRSLPDEQRETLELAYYQGYTQTQIAEMMQVPLGTVKGRMRLALHKLRSSLEGMQSPIGAE